jgi:hypothetical protein
MPATGFEPSRLDSAARSCTSSTTNWSASQSTARQLTSSGRVVAQSEFLTQARLFVVYCPTLNVHVEVTDRELLHGLRANVCLESCA